MNQTGSIFWCLVEMSYNRLAEVVFILRPAGPLADLASTIDDDGLVREWVSVGNGKVGDVGGFGSTR